MRIAQIIVRTLMGLLFLFASITFLFKLFPIPPMEGAVKTYNEGLNAVHLFHIVKVIELLCGLAFVTGKFNRLATIVIFPIVVNIVIFHAILEPSGLPVAIPLLLGNLFLAYYHREAYRPLFQP